MVCMLGGEIRSVLTVVTMGRCDGCSGCGRPISLDEVKMVMPRKSRGVKFQGPTGVSAAIPHGGMTKLGDWSNERPRLAVHRVEQKSSVSYYLVVVAAVK